MLVLGLMSGTSADGVDAVLAKFYGNPKRPKWQLLNLASIPYLPSLQKTIINVGQGLQLSSKDYLELAENITEVYAQAVFACDPKAKAEIVGCHGQTLWHRPPSQSLRGASWQILQAPLLAKLVNRPVIYDFRSKDLAHGGHGAPLVPLLDEAILGRDKGWRAVLNIGGIANLTLIPPNCGYQRFSFVKGWDCGPGNSLIDLSIQNFTNGKNLYDHDGSFAERGVVNELIIENWLEEDFFKIQPPKSTGREQFGSKDLEQRLVEMSEFSSEDIVATLTAFTAAVVANELSKVREHQLINPIELLVAGGGCRNPILLSQIRSRCRGMRVISIQEKGIPVEAREPLAFALLSWWHVLKYPGNYPSVTGAKKAAVLGVMVNN